MSENESKAKPVNILVTVDDQHREKLNNVAQDLESAGMTVAEVYSISGVIAGAAPGGDLGKLQSIQGVASIEEEPTFEGQDSV